MKRFLIILSVLIISTPVFAEMTQQQAKEALKDKGFLYGCTPANWSLAEPVRGGFTWAVMHGDVDVMELEKQAGLDITTCGKNMPFVSIFEKQPKALDFLLKNGYDVNTAYLDHSYLTFAIYRKNPEAVKVLIDNGVNVNMEWKNKNPLNAAIKKKQPEIVKMLLDAGAKPNEKTKKLIQNTKNQQIKSYFENI